MESRLFQPGLKTKWGLMVGLGLCWWVGSVEGRAQAVVEGVVALPETTPGRPVASARYGTLGVKGTAPEPATAVIYLEGAFPGVPVSGEVVRLAQKDLQFESSLLPVRVGTRVAFPNRDPAYHNVFSFSKPKRFDLGRYRPEEEPPPVLFDKPGVVQLYCEIHQHMRATVLVLETPYFCLAGMDGAFRMEGLPEGEYVLKAWLNDKQVWERPVKLVAGETARVEFGGGGP